MNNFDFQLIQPFNRHILIHRNAVVDATIIRPQIYLSACVTQKAVDKFDLFSIISNGRNGRELVNGPCAQTIVQNEYTNNNKIIHRSVNKMESNENKKLPHCILVLNVDSNDRCDSS